MSRAKKTSHSNKEGAFLTKRYKIIEGIKNSHKQDGWIYSHAYFDPYNPFVSIFFHRKGYGSVEKKLRIILNTETWETSNHKWSERKLGA